MVVTELELYRLSFGCRIFISICAYMNATITNNNTNLMHFDIVSDYYYVFLCLATWLQLWITFRSILTNGSEAIKKESVGHSFCNMGSALKRKWTEKKKSPLTTHYQFSCTNTLCCYIYSIAWNLLNLSNWIMNFGCFLPYIFRAFGIWHSAKHNNNVISSLNQFFFSFLKFGLFSTALSLVCDLGTAITI